MARVQGDKIVGAVVLVALVLVAIGCGSGQDTSPPPPPPEITIKTVAAFYSLKSPLNQNYAIAGEGAFTLLANGSGFTTSSVIEWNGSPLGTTFGDTTDLAAAVSASLIAYPGTASITVIDPSSGATSNVLPFAIASPAAATAGVIQLVTVATDGSPGDGDSLVAPSISADGRYVAFQSAATNLVPGPASGYQEIYERDTCIGAPSGCTANTTRITATYDGSPVNAHSRNSAISADGRYVAFDSQATNILPASSACGGLGSCVFVRDTCIGAPTGCTPTTFAVSVNTQVAIAPGSGPQMSPDARFESFGSSSSALGLGTATVGDLFLRDTCIGAASGCQPSTTQLSLTGDGSQGNQNSGPQAISSTGRFTAFESWATNMTSNETKVPGMFVRDTCTGAPGSCSPTTVRADVATDGTQPNNDVTNGVVPSMSNDGRLVAFGSTATNLVAINVNGACANEYGCAGVYVRDTCNGAPTGCTPSTSLASLANNGSVGNCSSPSQGLSMSANARFVAFDSIATNLTPDDTFTACSSEDIFIRDTCFGVTNGCVPSTVRVSVANTPNPGISANAGSGYPAISADGHYVVFISSATNLLSPPSNGHAMVYLAKTGF